jgi:outer membrane protein OmpA-like peptidoglycan-associated protein/tetratricopeptide (TPR) repeat protein
MNIKRDCLFLQQQKNCKMFNHTTNHSKLVLLIIAIFFSFIGTGQFTDQQIREFVKTASPKALLERNTMLIMDGNFYQSMLVADKLLELNSENANYNYRMGLALLNSSSNHYLSRPYLEKAILSSSKSFDLLSTKEENAPFDSYFYLGRCLHLSNEIDKAVKYYQEYITLIGKNTELLTQALLYIEQCKVAKYELSYPKKFEVINLGEVINTSNPEYAPVISLDGQSLYFTSRRLRADSSNANIKEPLVNMHMEDVYYSTKDNGADWQKPELIDFSLPERNEATVAVSTDERNIYIYKDDRGNGDIFFSEFQDGRFKELQPLDIPGVNTEFWEPHITVSTDGKSKYFSSDREGGYGGRDIYRIITLPNGEWSLPQNMGPTINGPYDEDAPFISLDNKTMYFSSNGPKSMGGFDVFISVKDSEGQWSAPLNLGYPLNSTGDDIYYTTTADGKTGYLSSFRKDGFGDKDIYEIRNDFLGQQNISLLKGEIVIAGDELVPEDIAVIVNCLNCDEANVRTVIPRIRDGKFFSTISKCSDYELIYTRGEDGVEFHRSTIKTNCLDDYEEIKERILLKLEKMSVIPFAKYTLAGTVADFVSKDKLEGVKVKFLDVDGNIFEEYTTGKSGNFQSLVLDKRFYGDKIDFRVLLTKEEYITQQFEVHLLLGKESHIELSYSIDKLEVGKDIAEVLEIHPIYFDLNKSDIRTDAEIELNKIVTIMNDNPAIKIELGSHTDCRGSKAFNMSLSNRRAKSSAEYIQKRITNPERIYGKGYGESKLVNNCGCEGDKILNCSEEQHQANRRTEFRIVH